MYEIIDGWNPEKRNEGLSKNLKLLEVGKAMVIDLRQRNSVFQIAANLGIRVTTKKINHTEVAVMRLS